MRVAITILQKAPELVLACLFLETDAEQELIIWNRYFLNKEEKKILNKGQEHMHWGRL